MARPAIQVSGLGKRYRIGELVHYKSLRDSIASAFAAPFRALGRGQQSESNGESETELWALRDVSFELGVGEVLAVIGANGSGKSTLLKILSKITEPTEGRGEIRGRVGSLLEVGTGFHRELTGRENVFLNGAILGMTRNEIRSRFDEIVAFAELERFIDTPVKHYSSGMYVRLAFAVAAHMEPEVLLVDEVLAVGDVEFQKKCLGRMQDVAKGGRTIVFVSHNMQAVSQLCPRAIWLDGGRVEADGDAHEVMGRYIGSRTAGSAEVSWPLEHAPGSDVAKLRSVRVLDDRGEPKFDVSMAQPISVEAGFWLFEKSEVHVSLHVFNQEGVLLFATGNRHDPEWHDRELEPGSYTWRCTIPDHYLNDGLHFVSVFLTRHHMTDAVVEEAVSFNVKDPGDRRFGWTDVWPGAVRPTLRWTGVRVGDLPN